MIISWVDISGSRILQPSCVITGVCRGPFAGGRAHDPQHRLLMAVPAAMNTR
jgi:hypothetical protein